MAKTFYENRFLLTRKLHKEFCRTTFLKMRKKLRVIWAIVSLVFFLIAASLYIFTKLRILPIFAIIIGLVFFYSIFQGYRFSEWVNYRSLCRETADVAGGEVVMITRFEPVQIHVKAGKTGYSFKYATIDRVLETTNLFILILKHEGMIEHSQILFKGGFTEKNEDTLDQFKKYLNEKTGKELWPE